MTAEGSRTLEPLYDINCGRMAGECFIPITKESAGKLPLQSSSCVLRGTCKKSGETRLATSLCNYVPEDDELVQSFFQQAREKSGTKLETIPPID